MLRAQLKVEGLSAFRAVDRLAKGGVEVLSARKTQKNALFIEVKSADLQKGFAILRASCYNVKKVRFLGVARLLRYARARAGLILGVLLFCATVPFVQSRVLRVDIVGSGSCYEAEARALLKQEGISFFSPAPENTARITAQILCYPRVSYCNVSHEAGRLTVQIEVSDDGSALPYEPLKASVSGKLTELTVMRGFACVAVGDEVQSGDILVDCQSEGERVVVIASATVQFNCEKPNADWSDEQFLSWAGLRYENARLTLADGRILGELRLSINMK